MLPDVVDQEREVSLQQRIYMAGGGGDFQRAARLLRLCQPDPAGAEMLAAGFRETRLECFVAAEIALDRGWGRSVRERTEPNARPG